jgi:hypothetical protein
VSTKCSIRYSNDPGQDFHLYEECWDVGDETKPVYLEMRGVDVVDLCTHSNGATITLAIPRALAKALGLPTAYAPLSTARVPKPTGTDPLPQDFSNYPRKTQQ